MLILWDLGALFAASAVSYRAGSLKSGRRAERSYRDPMTGLITRRGFEHQAQRMLKKEVGPLVVFMDLNDLKKVNDEYGHAAGDHFIREMSGRLRDWAQRRQGITARFGGDEFVAITRGSADFLLLKEELARPICWEGRTYYWTASVGSAVATVGLGREGRLKALSSALGQADQRMYKAKGGTGRR